jgi:hypothetical protein
MKPDELRRLAIRLALTEVCDGYSLVCGGCDKRSWNRPHRPRHYRDCPIAELEAEEARSNHE